MASLSSFLPSSGSASKPSGLRVFTVSKNATDWKPISKPTPTPAKITPTEAVSTKAVKITPTQKKLSPNQLQSFVKPYAEQAKQIGSKIQKAMPLTTQTINDIKTNKPFNIKQNQAENRQIAKQVFDDLKASFNDYMTKGISSEQKGISTGEKVIRKAETLVAGGKTAVKAFSGTFEILSNTPYIGKVIKAFSIPFAALEDSKVADKISNKTVDSLPVSNSVKNRIRPVVTDAVTLASQIALGHFLNVATKKAIKVSEKVGVDTFEKLTKNVIEQSGGSRVVNFTPKDVQNINLGKPVYEAELVKQLGLTSSEWKNAVQKGISVDVPAEKIVRIMDKPYWEKIKRVFKVSPTDKTVVDKGVTTPRGNFAGLLPSGEVAPSEVIGKIIQAGKENTAEGKAFIKAAVDAQKNGQTMTIEEQKTPIKDEQYIKDYRANYAKDLLNADDVREVFKSEGYNRVNSADFHDRATEITEKIFQQDLNTLKPGDKYLFTAGASGTGKTRAMSQYPDIKSNIKAGLDSNFSSNRALRRLGEVIDKGADPSIVFVYRDPIEAWDNGVLRRAANPDNRRVVPAPIFIDNLTDSPKKVLEAHNKYGDKVKIQVLDNSREIGKATLIENPIDYLKKIVYNVEDVKAHVIESTQNALKSGKISEATAKALLGEYSQKDSNISQSGKLEERGSSLDSEADKSLLESDLAKEADAEIMRPKVEKVNAKIQKIEEDLQMRRSDNEVKKSILDQFSTREIQAMRMIKRAIISRENKGRDPITVEETQVYKDNIRDVMAAIGTNSTDEAIRYIREDLPDPIVNASSRAELEQIKVLKSHLTPKEVEVPRSQIPVGTGKEKVSRLEARMKTELDKLTQDKIDELGLTTYKELNLKENRQKAAQYVTDNPTDALKVLKGEIEAPQGILKNNILWAMMQEAKGDMNLAIKLASIEATRFGQELVALRGIDPHNPIRLLNEVVRFREKQFEKRYGKKPVTQVREKIVRNIKDKVKKPDRYDWNSFINSIQC